jgi:hypothetical protein
VVGGTEFYAPVGKKVEEYYAGGLQDE